MHDLSLPEFLTAAQEIIATGHFLAAKGWAPATSGNYSMRLADGNIAITVSGYEKGQLTPEAIMVVDQAGNPRDERKPSAETVLHAGIYQACADCAAVLHTHSRETTVLSKLFPDMTTFPLTDYEFLKVYPGITSHEVQVDLPIFNNTQDMPALKLEIDMHLPGKIPAYLIRSHGLYAWGKNMADARRIVEATEFMLACELDIRRR